MIYHQVDNSARLRDPVKNTWTGWKDFYERTMPICDRLGVGLCIRQPIPTMAPTPLHMDGWTQTQQLKELWHNDFISVMNKIDRATDTPIIFYVGHAGGDQQDWPASNTNRPYQPAPSIKAALEKGDANALLDIMNKNLSPYLRAGNKRSWLYFDGSSRMQADHPVTEYLNGVRATMQYMGRVCGIESPPPLTDEYEHLADYSVAATWDTFINRLESQQNWNAYKGPRLVFCNGRFDADKWHEQMSARVAKVVKNDGVAAVPLHQVYSDGFWSINDWLKDNGQDFS